MTTLSRWTRVLLVLSLFVAVSVAPASAQRLDGTVRGTVTDPSGAAISGATVTVTNVDTGVEKTATTTSVGVYQVQNLLVGNYTVTVQASNFQTYKRTNIVVSAAKVTEVDGSLKVGSSSEVVEVSVGANVVQTESSQLSSSFSGRQITEIPASFGGTGSVQNLAIYAPNTTTQLGGTSGNGGSVGGLRGRQNSFTIDGTTNNDGQVSVSSVEVIPDAVQEFGLSTNQFSAEYGSAAGGQFNIVTKSGANDTHGALYWYDNNRRLNALDNLEKLRGKGHDRFDYNRLGANIGGAVIKDKLFFFGAYQFRATGLAASAPTASAPTAAGYAALNGIAVDQAVKDLMGLFPVAAAQSGTPQQICKRADRTNRGSQGVPNASGGDTCVAVPFGPLSAVSPSFVNNQQWLANVDYNINSKHQLRFRTIKDRLRGPTAAQFPQAIFDAASSTDTRRGSINEVWSINNHMVNEFKASASRLDTDSGKFPNPIAATYPTILFTGAVNLGPSNNLPQWRKTNTYELADEMSYVRGKHSFKGGFEYTWFTGPNNFLQNERGQHAYINFEEFVNDFVPVTTGTNLKGIGSGLFSQNRKNMASYFQDDWKITRRITLNLGLRYEFFGVPKGANLNGLDNVSDCPSCTANPFATLLWHAPKNDYNNFAPRVGFAWDPTGSGKWAVRGGFGMGYDHIPGNFYLNGAPPQFQAVLNPQTACAGALGSKPVWCPASGAPSTSTAQYLGNGAMNGITFIPPSSQAFARSLTGNLMSDNVSPMVYSWSASVQRELFKNTVIEGRYLGTRAKDLPIQIQLNALSAFDNGATPLPTYFSASDVPTSAPATAPTLANFNAKVARPYASSGFTGVITAFPPVGESKYQGGSVNLTHTAGHGLMFNTNYTFSRARDNATNDLFTSVVNPRRPEDFRHLGREWGRSALDVQNKFAATWVYDIPKAPLDSAFGKGVLWGWTYSGTYLWQGGQPVTVLSGLDANGNGDSATDRAILNPNGSGRTASLVTRVCRNSGTGAVTVNAACTAANTIGYVANDPTAKYIRADVGTLTNTLRDTEDSGGFNIWNMSFRKENKITERWSTTFSADVFNVFNHRNFTLGNASIFGTNTNATTSTYSNISTSTVGPTGQNLFLNDKQFNGGSRVVALSFRVKF